MIAINSIQIELLFEELVSGPKLPVGDQLADVLCLWYRWISQYEQSEDR
jgi:hypothetical protein